MRVQIYRCLFNTLNFNLCSKCKLSLLFGITVIDLLSANQHSEMFTRILFKTELFVRADAKENSTFTLINKMGISIHTCYPVTNSCTQCTQLMRERVTDHNVMNISKELHISSLLFTLQAGTGPWSEKSKGIQWSSRLQRQADCWCRQVCCEGS